MSNWEGPQTQWTPWTDDWNDTWQPGWDDKGKKGSKGKGKGKGKGKDQWNQGRSSTWDNSRRPS